MATLTPAKRAREELEQTPEKALPEPSLKDVTASVRQEFSDSFEKLQKMHTEPGYKHTPKGSVPDTAAVCFFCLRASTVALGCTAGVRKTPGTLQAAVAWPARGLRKA